MATGGSATRVPRCSAFWDARRWRASVPAIVDTVHPQDRGLVADALSQAAVGPSAPQSWRMRHRDGSWRVLEAICTGLSGTGAPGVIVNSRDVTERRRAEALVSAQNRALGMIAADAPLDDVLDSVAALSRVAVGRGAVLDPAARRRERLPASRRGAQPAGGVRTRDRERADRPRRRQLRLGRVLARTRRRPRRRP